MKRAKAGNFQFSPAATNSRSIQLSWLNRLYFHGNNHDNNEHQQMNSYS